MYPYRRIAIRFPNVRRLEWVRPLDLTGSTDPDGTVDYGNIDWLSWRGDTFGLGGDWGEVELESDPPVIDMLDVEDQPRSADPNH